MNGKPPFGQPGPLPFGQPGPALNAGIPGLKGSTQFSLGSLFEFTTICCLLAGLSGIVGIVAGSSLAAFALSLAARNGASAIIMLMTASLTAGLVGTDDGSAGFISQLAVFTAAALICLWYRRRHASLIASP
jgi:hypothetical protein